MRMAHVGATAGHARAGPRALFVMPPFSRHARRRNWRDLERFYNPCGVFERVVLVSLDERDPGVPAALGSLRIVPLDGGRPRWPALVLGRGAYGALDPVARAVARLAREHRVDLVVQRYGGPLRHGVAVVWAAQVLGLPSVVTYQNDYPRQLRSTYGPGMARLRALADAPAWHFVHSRASVVWAVSAFLRDEAIARGVPAARVVTIPNKDGIGAWVQRPDEVQTRALLARIGVGCVAGEVPLLVAVGRLIPQKNHLRQLDAFARAAGAGLDARLVVVGQGPQREALLARARALGLSGRMRLVDDYLTADELRVLFHRAAALVFCSLFEGQGRVAYEAMACGTPVIGARVGPLPELVRGGETGWLVDPLDEAAIARAMVQACAAPARRPRMAAACRATAARFDLDVVDPQEADLYRRLLDAGATSRAA